MRSARFPLAVLLLGGLMTIVSAQARGANVKLTAALLAEGGVAKERCLCGNPHK